MANFELAPMLCSVRDAADALGIGITKTYALISENRLEAGRLEKPWPLMA
jgi:hypothetical protein